MPVFTDRAGRDTRITARALRAGMNAKATATGLIVSVLLLLALAGGETRAREGTRSDDSSSVLGEMLLGEMTVSVYVQQCCQDGDDESDPRE